MELEWSNVPVLGSVSGQLHETQTLQQLQV